MVGIGCGGWGMIGGGVWLRKGWGGVWRMGYDWGAGCG